MTIPRYVIVADPDSLRCRFFIRELEEYWAASGRVPEIHVLDWRQLCEPEFGVWDPATIIPDQRSLLRIESPARDLDVVKSLLQCGQISRGEKVREWPELIDGWIAPQQLLFSGLTTGLERLADATSSSTSVVNPYLNEDVLSLFDKNRTSSILRNHGLPTPDSFAVDGSFSELVQQLSKNCWESAFVKLSNGSCASGIMALASSGLAGITTVQEIEGQFYNSYRVRTVEGDELRSIASFILMQGATIQRAIAKMTVGGRNFDVRVVVMGRRVIATVFRVSGHPMTNLHLGGRRGDPGQCRARIPQRHWLDAMDVCVEAASLFRVPCVGVDIAFDRRTNKPAILEVNAFGDFFPRWVNKSGHTIHRMQIEDTAELFD